MGAASAAVWAAKSAYLIETGLRYAQLNVEAPNVVVVRFFGVFFMITYMGQVSLDTGSDSTSWIETLLQSSQTRMITRDRRKAVDLASDRSQSLEA